MVFGFYIFKMWVLGGKFWGKFEVKFATVKFKKASQIWLAVADLTPNLKALNFYVLYQRFLPILFRLSHAEVSPLKHAER